MQITVKNKHYDFENDTILCDFFYNSIKLNLDKLRLTDYHSLCIKLENYLKEFNNEELDENTIATKLKTELTKELHSKIYY